MVRSIQPEWICGHVPPAAGAVRHGQAIEMINGIYAVHVLDQQRRPTQWYEGFRKIWHRGGHSRDFDKTYRGARTDDHDYYKTHYEPGRKALAHHQEALAETDAWRRRTEQLEQVTKILKKTGEIEKRRQSFRDLPRHKQEQKDIWSKAEQSIMKLVGMTTIEKTAPRARDMLQFNPQRIGNRGHLVPIGIAKDTNVFHPEYTNLYKLDRYLKNLDSIKRGLLQDLKERPGRVPYEKLWNIPAPTINPTNNSVELEVREITNFEKRLDDLIQNWRAKESLRPPMPENFNLSQQFDCHNEGESQNDYQTYGC